MRTWAVVGLVLLVASAGTAQLAIRRSPVPEARAESAAMGADRAEANRLAQELGFDRPGSGSPLGAPGEPVVAPTASPSEGSPLVATGAAPVEPQAQSTASGQPSSAAEPLPRLGVPPGKRIEILIPVPDAHAWHSRQWANVLEISTPAERQFERCNERQWESEQLAARAAWAAADAVRARAERDADRLNEARWRRHGAIPRGRPSYVLR